jgi:hypothetical protein
MKRLMIIGIFLFLGGCSNTAPYEPSERDEQLMKAYASLLLHQERFGRTVNPDSVRLYHQKTDSILSSYSLGREEFQTEFEQLINSPDRFEPLFQKIYTDLQLQSRK